MFALGIGPGGRIRSLSKEVLRVALEVARTGSLSTLDFSALIHGCAAAAQPFRSCTIMHQLRFPPLAVPCNTLNTAWPGSLPTSFTPGVSPPTPPSFLACCHRALAALPSGRLPNRAGWHVRARS
ncbi:uncharacterized protein B0H18DRAFT_164570 [Fomitopsis serialis]|uniref:uncharacterized protein n=1 Tax=Fomitopsis serialis TaxID=139415 RepID=UPI002008D175|nr:uncharacterized protein B0H18DRAFT_164570 [Neoantrodia serialis]KAH9913647.1 hypothetical protein B0H18DRAFT_164570 [Neoantrodia serialis]